MVTRYVLNFMEFALSLHKGLNAKYGLLCKRAIPK
jgi:hypothetical protein